MPAPETVRVADVLHALVPGKTPVDSAEATGASVEVASCPWRPEHLLAVVGVRLPAQGAVGLGQPMAPLATTLEVHFDPGQVDAYRPIGLESGTGATPDGTAVLPVDRRRANLLCEIIPHPGTVPGGIPEGETVTSALQRSGRAVVGAAVVRSLGERPPAMLRVATADGMIGSAAGRGPAPNWTDASAEFRFTAGAALFGLLLRQDPAATGGWDLVQALVEPKGSEAQWPFRAELLEFLQQARAAAAP